MKGTRFENGAPANKPKTDTPEATLTIDLFWMTSKSFLLVEGKLF
jgi:hypothetical protein